MFQVWTLNKVDDQWETRDELLFTAAGRSSDQGSSSFDGGRGGGVREHVWYVEDFGTALVMKKTLSKIPGVQAFLKEC